MAKSQRHQAGPPILEVVAHYSQRTKTIIIEVPKCRLDCWGQIDSYDVLRNGSQPTTAAGPRGISVILHRHEHNTGGVTIRINGSSPNPANGDHQPGVVMFGVNPNKVRDITELAAAIMQVCCVPGVRVKLTSRTVQSQPAKPPAGAQPSVPDARRRNPNRGMAGKRTSATTRSNR